jgi:hypothetical protein
MAFAKGRAWIPQGNAVRKLRCKKGHRLSKRNTEVDTRGKRKCRTCAAIWRKASYKANAVSRREAARLGRKKLKDEIFRHYGESCSCCGVEHREFLTIDHINGHGREHRKSVLGEGRESDGSGFFRWLKKAGFPQGFQTLCWNCNIGRYRNAGICPHKKSS